MRDSKIVSTKEDLNMKKMKTVFVIDRELDCAIPEVNPEAKWVLDGEGIATVKFDGTATFFKNGIFYKRFDRKLKDKFKNQRKREGDKFIPKDYMFKDVPEGAIPCEEAPDMVTFHFPHWIPVTETPENKWFIEAFNNTPNLEDGATYEMVGPCVQNNVYNLTKHELWKHGSVAVNDVVRTFDGFKEWLLNNNCEGLVFHHPDGRMCKIRKKDFLLPWNKEHLRK